MGSLHLHLPHLKLLDVHCPVGDGAVPGLCWLFNRRLCQSEHDRFLLLLVNTFSNSSLAPSNFTAMFNFTVSRCFRTVDARPTSFGPSPLCRLLWHTRQCRSLSVALLFVDILLHLNCRFICVNGGSAVQLPLRGIADVCFFYQLLLVQASGLFIFIFTSSLMYSKATSY
jgi:hypothetical protein